MTGGPVDRHRVDATEILASGDPAAIKRLYVDLGEDMWETHREQPDAVPVFSFAGTHGVVAGSLREVRGLLLDAGCGPNPALSISLAQAGSRRVVALDIGLGTVRSAMSVAGHRGVSLVGIVGDVENLPFRAGAFDGVACDDTIEHLPSPEAGAAELRRVARADATVVVATPNRRSLGVLRRKAADLVRGRRRPRHEYFVSTSHIREYTWRECEELLDPHLVVTGREVVGFDGRRTNAATTRVVNALVSLGPLRHLGSMIVLVTRPRP